MVTLRDRDREFLTEIGKLGKDIADDVGGSQAIQAAVVQSVMLIMAGQDVARRSTYQSQDIDNSPQGQKQPKKRL